MIARLLQRLKARARQEWQSWRDTLARADLEDARHELAELDGRYATERFLLEADHRHARSVVQQRIAQLEATLAPCADEVAR